MKKILLAFDGNHFSNAALEFARKLNQQEPIMLTGAFLPQVDYANLWSYSGGAMAGTSYVPLVEDADAEAVKENIQRFEEFCKKNNIQYSVHKDYFDFAIPELRKESKFADLMIISSEVFYEQAGTDSPNEYLKEIMHEASCPVLVIPEKFEFPQSNILSCDGSESSIYAIKQFAYLFPSFTRNESVLAYAKDSWEDDMPNEKNVTELVASHFPNYTVIRLSDNNKTFFANWLWERKNSIVVSGAFGRSELSMLFRKSYITTVISDHRLPVFIAHR